MPHGILGHDHPVLEVGDDVRLNEVRHRFEAMGFTFATRLDVTGKYSDRIILQDTYFAIIGIYDHTKLTSRQVEYLDRPYALRKIYFLTKDAAATSDSLALTGVPVELWNFVNDLERPDGTVRTPHRCVELWSLAKPNLRLVGCQHDMPDLLFREEWQTHANGARDISTIVLIESDLDARQDALAPVFGADACIRKGDSLQCIMGKGRLLFLTHDAIEARYPGQHFPKYLTPPFVASVTVRVSATRAVEDRLKKEKVAYEKSARGSVLVNAETTGCMLLEFFEGDEL